MSTQSFDRLLLDQVLNFVRARRTAVETQCRTVMDWDVRHAMVDTVNIRSIYQSLVDIELHTGGGQAVLMTAMRCRSLMWQGWQMTWDIFPFYDETIGPSVRLDWTPPTLSTAEKELLLIHAHGDASINATSYCCSISSAHLRLLRDACSRDIHAVAQVEIEDPVQTQVILGAAEMTVARITSQIAAIALWHDMQETYLIEAEQKLLDTVLQLIITYKEKQRNERRGAILDAK